MFSGGANVPYEIFISEFAAQKKNFAKYRDTVCEPMVFTLLQKIDSVKSAGEVFAQRCSEDGADWPETAVFAGFGSHGWSAPSSEHLFSCADSIEGGRYE